MMHQSNVEVHCSVRNMSIPRIVMTSSDASMKFDMETSKKLSADDLTTSNDILQMKTAPAHLYASHKLDKDD